MIKCQNGQLATTNVSTFRAGPDRMIRALVGWVWAVSGWGRGPGNDRQRAACRPSDIGRILDGTRRIFAHLTEIKCRIDYGWRPRKDAPGTGLKGIGSAVTKSKASYSLRAGGTSPVHQASFRCSAPHASFRRRILARQVHELGIVVLIIEINGGIGDKSTVSHRTDNRAGPAPSTLPTIRRSGAPSCRQSARRCRSATLDRTAARSL